MSEYSDVLYDFREHTHRSCLEEVKNCDMLVLIIGSRFGSELSGEDVAEIAGQIDVSLLRQAQRGVSSPRISITQAEALTAASNGIPVFAFIERGVSHDYQTYKQNLGKPFADEIEYASVSKPGTAQYIFGFVEFLNKRRRNNALIVFENIDDIYAHLQKQWSALFQKLLNEARAQQVDAIRIDRLAEQFEDLKAALLSTIGADRRQIARAAIRFRRLLTFLRAIPNSGTPMIEMISTGGCGWLELLSTAAHITSIERHASRTNRWITILQREGYEPYYCELDQDSIEHLGDEWEAFISLDKATREAIYQELVDTIQPAELSVVGLIRADSALPALPAADPRNPSAH